MRKTLVTTMLSTLFLIGCGGGGSSDNSDPVDPPTTVTGQFIDGPVEGLGYTCSSGKKGFTDRNGFYTCNEGDEITFSVGPVIIGKSITITKEIITPYTLFPNDDTASTNFVRLLQSVQLPNASQDTIILDQTRLNLLPPGLDFSAASFEADVETALSITLITRREAQIAMYTFVTSAGGTVEQTIPDPDDFSAGSITKTVINEWDAVDDIDSLPSQLFTQWVLSFPIDPTKLVNVSLKATISIIVGTNFTSVLKGDTAQVTIKFTEAVKDFSNEDVSVDNGTLSTLSTADNITYSATFTPTDSITDTSNVVTVGINITDVDGNRALRPSISTNYTIDTTSPSATITMSDTALIKGETSQVTIKFTEAVKDFSNEDVTVGNGTLDTLNTADNITYSATFTPTDLIADTSNVVSLADTYTDAGGNRGTASSSANYMVDTVAVVVPPVTYSIGDTGPAGGIVFYISDDLGLHGLEAAPVDFLPGSFEFGCLNVDIGEIGEMPGDIGTGLANTLEIIAATCTPSVVTNSIAAVGANDYSLNGFEDWYLPSIDELNELYLYVLNTGTIDNELFYWSSSESGIHKFETDPPTEPLLIKGWYFGPDDFGVRFIEKDGGSLATTGSGYPKVRPVRTF